MTRLPPSSIRHAELATAAISVLAPRLRALARSMGVDADAAIAEGWIAAHCRARRGLDPTAHIGWILASVRRALRKEWVSDSADALQAEMFLSITREVLWADAPEDPLVAILDSPSFDSQRQAALLDSGRANALTMALRARASNSPRTRRYWRARAWAVLASIGITGSP